MPWTQHWSSKEQITVLQYADDTAIIVSDDPSIAHILQVYSKFKLAAGAKVNMDKRAGVWLGP